jgi:hypothetical protein
MSELLRAGAEFQADLLGIARSTAALHNRAAVSIGLQIMGKC